MGSNNVMHGVYNYASPSPPCNCIIFSSPILQVGVAQAHEPPTIIHFALFPSGYHHTDQLVDGSESILQTTWVDLSAMTSGVGISGRQVCPKRIKAEHSPHKMMVVCPNWGKVLAYLCVYLRITICCGHSNNPQLLTNVKLLNRLCKHNTHENISLPLSCYHST
jgi:hypothetical protein